MGTHNPNGGRHTPDENRPSWRPQDQTTSSVPRDRGNEDDHDDGSWRERNQDRPVNERDPSRWEGSRGSELGYQGPYDQRMGYQGGYDQRMGHQGGYGAQGYGGSQDDPQRVGSFGQHRHRGTGPHRGKGPSGYQRSDERIRELVSEALADDDQIDASQIQVTVKDGEVTLSGIVDDRRTRREAEDCVASISGVRDVQVQLRVKDDRQGQGMKSSTTLGTANQGAGKHETETSQDRKPRA
jgi:osmotically-inducible protein OsmY